MIKFRFHIFIYNFSLKMEVEGLAQSVGAARGAVHYHLNDGYKYRSHRRPNETNIISLRCVQKNCRVTGRPILSFNF